MQIYSIFFKYKSFLQKKFFFRAKYVCLQPKILFKKRQMEHHQTDYQVSNEIIAWFQKNKRNLPWRETNDPFRIWISEIILQQTRVQQGIDYFERFVRRFPDIESLALAQEEEVLKLWQGLGYYSRARNLHEAAKLIHAKYQRVFPTKYEDILALKGVGSYTAAAIASLAWNQPYPVLDGNVYRVLGRLFAIETPYDTGKGRKIYKDLACLLMNPQKAGLHNQAIMEFGALQCVPQNPECHQCPLINRCLGYASGNPQQFPVKQYNNKVRARYFNYFFVVHEGHTYLSRRTKKDIWEGLFEIPLIETNHPMDLEEIVKTDDFKELFQHTGQVSITVLEKNGVKHVLTHQILHAKFYKIEISEENPGLKNFLKVPLEQVDEYAVPRLIHRFFIDFLK